MTGTRRKEGGGGGGGGSMGIILKGSRSKSSGSNGKKAYLVKEPLGYGKRQNSNILSKKGAKI